MQRAGLDVFNERCQALPPQLRAPVGHCHSASPTQLSLCAPPNQPAVHSCRSSPWSWESAALHGEPRDQPGLPFRGAQPRSCSACTQSCVSLEIIISISTSDQRLPDGQGMSTHNPQDLPGAGPQWDSWAHPLPGKPGQRVQPLILPAAAIISCNEEDPNTGTFQKDLMFYDRPKLCREKA